MDASAATPSDRPSGSMALFFALALGITWVALLPAVLATAGLLAGGAEAYMVGALPAIFAPTIAAVVAARREGGPARVRELLGGLTVYRVHPIWYLVVLALPGLVFAAGRVVYGVLGLADGGAFAYFPVRPEHFLGMVLVPIGEEIGWRGYALPRLIARHGAMRATLILGALWGVWHVPMFLSSGLSGLHTVEAVGYIFAGSAMFTWVYRRTGGSLLMAVLLHVGAHLDTPSHGGFPESSIPLHIAVAAMTVFSLLLVLADRRAFSGTTPGVAPNPASASRNVEP